MLGSVRTMSIATRTGDNGTTGLMYNRRVSKCHPRVEAYGTLDELNAALGLARSLTLHPFIRETLLPIQRDLVAVMGELATVVDDLGRYEADGHPRLSSEWTARLDQAVHAIEEQRPSFRGWATPGATPGAAALDLARTVARRAERRVCALQEAGELRNPEMLVYLNRLSDLLWLMARWVEHRATELGSADRSPLTA